MKLLQFTLQMTEVEVQGRIGFQLEWSKGTVQIEELWPAMVAFQRLYREVLWVSGQRGRVTVRIKGHLGQDVEKTFDATQVPTTFIRGVFRAWYTQAVQARAAVIRQPIFTPSLGSQEGLCCRSR
jgi:hypothetical protein